MITNDRLNQLERWALLDLYAVCEPCSGTGSYYHTYIGAELECNSCHGVGRIYTPAGDAILELCGELREAYEEIDQLKKELGNAQAEVYGLLDEINMMRDATDESGTDNV